MPSYPDSSVPENVLGCELQIDSPRETRTLVNPFRIEPNRLASENHSPPLTALGNLGSSTIQEG